MPLKMKSLETRKKRMVLFLKKMKKDSAWKWKCMGSAFKWKRLHLQGSFIDVLIFKIASILEAIFLVAKLCFFFLCYGCRF